MYSEEFIEGSVKLPNHNCAVLGITNIDEMMAQKAHNEEILKQNLRLIEGIASNFSSVLYVNLGSGSFTYHVVEKNWQAKYDKYAKGMGMKFSRGITRTAYQS